MGTLEPGFGKDRFSVKKGAVLAGSQECRGLPGGCSSDLNNGVEGQRGCGVGSELADSRENDLEGTVSARRRLAVPLGLTTGGCCLRQGRVERAC